MSKFTPKKYLVVYFDFLGQKEFFKDIVDVNVSSELDEKISHVSDSVRKGFVGFKLLSEKIVSGCDTLFEQLRSRQVPPYYSAPQEWFSYEMSRCKPKVHSFSDGTMVYFPLTEDMAPVILPMVMFQLCHLFLQSLNEGSLYRGCITFGDGWEIDDGVLYGPVVDRAAHIEKNVAVYPRIVVSDEIMDYFNINKIECLSPRIDKMVEVDSDGSFILSYLSLEFLTSPILGKDKDVVWDYVRYMHWFVRKELTRFRDKGDVKMYLRYRMWDAYSFRHEEELMEKGILRNEELSKGYKHPPVSKYPLGKYLVFYLQFQPEPLQKLGYDGLMENAEIISRVAKDIESVQRRLKDNAKALFEEQFGSVMTQQEIEREVAMIRNASCGTVQMSNYLMLYVRNIGHCGGHYFSIWLLRMKDIIRSLATNGIFVRGSIEYDIGWELDDGILYGPVIQKAASLEDGKAFYPRIVISDNIVTELNNTRKGGSPYFWGHQYIRQDEDNIWIFDYLELGDDDKVANTETKNLPIIEAGAKRAHQICESILRRSRKGFVINPKEAWPALSLDMYFRRKLSEASDKSSKQN